MFRSASSYMKNTVLRRQLYFLAGSSLTVVPGDSADDDFMSAGLLSFPAHP